MNDQNRPEGFWESFAQALAPVEVITEPVLIKKRSRDFFWYSPILNAELRRSFGDLVACPATSDEVAKCLAQAFAADVAVTIRGGGSGNYGQAVPRQGGLILDMTRMNRILEIGQGFVRCEAGALMADINRALAETGQELAMFPSTQDIATIGGFVAGGSAGIGSIANGALREKGNIRSLTALPLDAAPEPRVFDAEEALNIHHAWGMNGVITEVTMRTVPRRDWIGCMVAFDTYRDAYAAGYDLSVAEDIGRKLVSVVDARIVDYFPRLQGKFPTGKHLLVSLLPREDMARFEALMTLHGGQIALALDDAQREAAGIPHVFEFAYNHTTLQVLKSDRSATYQQYGMADPSNVDQVMATHDGLGEDVWPHHEFARVDGIIHAFELPIIWFSDEARLREIDDAYRALGHSVADAHCNWVEGGGLKPNYRYLAWKKRMDPKGLLNPGKSKHWPELSHLSPEEIEAMAQ